MIGRAFVCGLGRMGRRHVETLIACGYRVVGYDAHFAVTESLGSALRAGGSRTNCFEGTSDIASGAFDIAIFSEIANARLRNLETFLSRGRARKILLEKPLCSDPTHLAGYQKLISAFPEVEFAVHFPFRGYPIFQKLRELCNESPAPIMTVTGGAKGLGGNGVHYLDLFFQLCNEGPGRIALVKLDKEIVASPRGCFPDFGGYFVLQRGNATFLCSLDATSSAPVEMSLVGNYFRWTLSEFDWSHRLLARSPNSKLASHAYGQDYACVDGGQLPRPTESGSVARWITGEARMSDLPSALEVHKVLFAILAQGGATPPFQFT